MTAAQQARCLLAPQAGSLCYRLTETPCKKRFQTAMKFLCAFLLSACAAFRISAAEKTVEERVREFGPAVRERLAPLFQAASIPFPPPAVTLIGLKEERLLQVYAQDAEGGFRCIRDYPVLAASGHLGPKLREGDQQVPEGIYRLEALNPNSRFHLALRLDYPNQWDRAHAQAEGRARLGGLIMIHGKERSIGCLAMGDPAIEDLFVLAALTGLEKVRVVLAPRDFRTQELPVSSANEPKWLSDLYLRIKAELAKYPAPFF